MRWPTGGDLIQLADPVMGVMLAMSKYIPAVELKYLPLRHLLRRFDQLKQAITPKKK